MSNIPSVIVLKVVFPKLVAQTVIILQAMVERVTFGRVVKDFLGQHSSSWPEAMYSAEGRLTTMEQPVANTLIHVIEMIMYASYHLK